MHRGGPGDDVTRVQPRGRVPAPVGDHPTGCPHEQGARGDVPRSQVLLEVAVEHARRGPREVHARRAGPTQVLEGEEGALEHREVLREPFMLGAEREAGGADGAPGHALPHPDRITVAERAAAPPRREDIAEHGRVHHADDRFAVGDERDRHPHHRQAVHEVGRPVERVDEPADVGALAATLLTEERELGRRVVEHRLDGRFARGVGIAHPVAGALLAHVARTVSTVDYPREK